MDEELLELSKKVYDLTKWNPNKNGGFNNWMRENVVTKSDKYSQAVCPRYTSDFLLDKLKEYEVELSYGQGNISKVYGWRAFSYHQIDEVSYIREKTPLLALLKLTLELHEAGVKL